MLNLMAHDVSCRIALVLLVGAAFAVGAFAAPPQHHEKARAADVKVDRHDPAFRTGYMDGYRQGANDSQALSSSYKDQSGPVYEEALDGYTPEYGDRATYELRFRRGYIAGYKDGWDFNSGKYSPLGGIR